MRKTLRNIIASGVIASALTLGACTPAYHGRLIERRENIPTFNDSAERWQAFYNSIDENAVTRDELEFVNHYSSLNKEQRGRYVEELNGVLKQLSPEVEAKRRNGELTNTDLIFIYSVYRDLEDSFKGKIHF